MRKSRHRAPVPSDDPSAAAEAARLRYVQDTQPGIHRRRTGRGFRYVGVDGAPVREAAMLAANPRPGDSTCVAGRLDLPGGARPPPGRRARCPRAQAVPLPSSLARRAGRDQVRTARGVRPRPAAHSRAGDGRSRPPGLTRAKVLATVVRLLETTAIRVGNEAYVRQNGSFGLTTLRSRHVTVQGSQLCFEFRGKGGKRHRVRSATGASPGSSGGARSSGPGALPVPRRIGTEPDDRLGRHQRVPA